MLTLLGIIKAFIPMITSDKNRYVETVMGDLKQQSSIDSLKMNGLCDRISITEISAGFRKRAFQEFREKTEFFLGNSLGTSSPFKTLFSYQVQV